MASSEKGCSTSKRINGWVCGVKSGGLGRELSRGDDVSTGHWTKKMMMRAVIGGKFRTEHELL